MKPNTQLLHQVWSQSSEQITRNDIALERFKLDELISSVFSSGPFYFYIIDFFDMQIKYMSPQVEAIHGLVPDQVCFQDILDQIHPDDMDYVSRAEARTFELFKDLGPERIKKYKTSYCFRFRTADGSYQLFNHQAIILTADEQGRIAKSLNVHTNISHLTRENNYKVSAIGMFGEPSYLNLDVAAPTPLAEPTQSLFSKREQQIIRLMAEGLTSLDIAGKLCIALNTVNNHRKNILAKAGCKNTSQLITRCITRGLV